MAINFSSWISMIITLDTSVLNLLVLFHLSGAVLAAYVV